MKRLWIAALAAGVMGVALTGCATTSGTVAAADSAAVKKAQDDNNTTVQANKTYIRDWTARSLGGAAIPDWLATVFLGDYREYKEHYKIENGYVVRHSTVTAADVRGAQLRADIDYARKIAKELHQSVKRFLASRTRSGAIDKATRDAVDEVLQAQSSVEISGHEMRTEFYHIVDEEDALTGKMTRKCVLYQVYVIPEEAWARTTAAYLRNVIDAFPEELSRDEKFVADLVEQMMGDARHPTVMTQKQKEQDIELSKEMLEAQINLAPAEQKAAAKQKLVEIMQNAKTERTKIRAEAQTRQVESLGDAQIMAAMSEDPVIQSAATVTPADKGQIDAEGLVLDILFNRR